MVFCKAAGMVFIMGAAYYFAFSYNQAVDLRMKQLRKLYSIFLQLKSEIEYMYNTLPECFEKLAKNEMEPFKDWFTQLVMRMEENKEVIFKDVWQGELEHLYENSALEKEDIEPLYELSDKLGNADISSQLKAIDYALLHIEGRRITLEGEISQKKKVVVTMSLFVGFMTLILFI